MRTVRIGQTLALVCIILVVALQAAAQAPAPPAVATAPYAPVALPGLDWLALIKEVGFPAAAFVLLFILYRTSLSDNTRAINDLRSTIGDLRVTLAGMKQHCEEKSK
jgi:inactivated superfamily I helicase